MSTHPNVILMAVLTPDGLSRATMRDILAECKLNSSEYIEVAGISLRPIVMESDYHDGYQLSAQEGDLVFFDMVTYGYGEVIGWSELDSLRAAVEGWAVGICERHNCSYKIMVTANYW